MQKIESKSAVEYVDRAIRSRRTQKVLAESALVQPVDSRMDLVVDELLVLASYAPFHKKCDESYRQGKMDAAVPWRMHILSADNCRLLRAYIDSINLKTGKIANMLGTADALIIVTWLPDHDEDLVHDHDEEAIPFKGDIKNMEHVAAAAAAIQNMLIGAASRQIPNYWSSGGHLRSKILRDYMKIPMEEIVLGAIFLFPENSEDLEVDIKPGKLRELGKDISKWSRTIELAGK